MKSYLFEDKYIKEYDNTCEVCKEKKLFPCHGYYIGEHKIERAYLKKDVGKWVCSIDCRDKFYKKRGLKMEQMFNVSLILTKKGKKYFFGYLKTFITDKNKKEIVKIFSLAKREKVKNVYGDLLVYIWDNISWHEYIPGIDAIVLATNQMSADQDLKSEFGYLEINDANMLTSKGKIIPTLKIDTASLQYIT